MFLVRCHFSTKSVLSGFSSWHGECSLAPGTQSAEVLVALNLPKCLERCQSALQMVVHTRYDGQLSCEVALDEEKPHPLHCLELVCLRIWNTYVFHVQDFPLSSHWISFRKEANMTNNTLRLKWILIFLWADIFCSKVGQRLEFLPSLFNTTVSATTGFHSCFVFWRPSMF